ncbi:E7 [Kittiwake papillomavirus 2]|uniref:E7 n=1 Tax=Kittiwake papillomavirus 2 TaxID=2562551 RepID=A0AAE5YMK5_9PAPI|nr:E7 [Kittiwake papillomavirus 2]
MRSLDPTGQRPEPMNSPPGDSVLDDLYTLIEGGVPTPETGSDTDIEGDDDYELACAEGLGEDDSGEEVDVEHLPFLDTPFPSYEELMAEVSSPPDYQGDTLTSLGWRCEYCDSGLTGWELEVHGPVDALRLTGLCNMCYTGGLEDIFGTSDL